jgi:hypothetical protein
MRCECYRIGGPFIAEDPNCPIHGYEAQAREKEERAYRESEEEKQNELLARIIALEEKIDAMPQCAQPAPSFAEQDQINAEAAIRSIYGARPNDEALWQTIVNGMITPAHIAQAVADGTITSAYIMQPAPSVPEGFSREDLEAVAAGLDGYEKTVNVGNVTGEGDDHLESTTAYAARFIRAMLAAAPEAKP